MTGMCGAIFLAVVDDPVEGGSSIHRPGIRRTSLAGLSGRSGLRCGRSSRPGRAYASAWRMAREGLDIDDHAENFTSIR